MDYFYKLNSMHHDLTITYLCHEQYCELEVTTSCRKNSASWCCCGRMRRAINALANSQTGAGSGPHKIALSRRRYSRSHGVILRFTNFSASVRPPPVSEALRSDRKIFRELCVSFAWMGRSATKSHQQEFP